MEIRELEAREWLRLKGIFEREFDSDLPIPQNAKIFGCFEGEKMLGFILAENVVFIGQVYVIESERTSGAAKKMLSFVREKFSRERKPVAAVASEKRFEMLFKSLGMTEIGGKLFRRN